MRWADVIVGRLESHLRRMLSSLIVLLVVNVIGLDAQTIMVSERPVLSIGEVEGDPRYLLSQVSHVRQLSDGRIMVTMGPHIRFYGSEGEHIGDAGGSGRGPGEFQHIQDVVVLPGDTLMILHFSDIVWLSPEGKYIRQNAIDMSPLSRDGWASEGAVLLPNGNLLAPQYEREVAPPRGLHRPTLRYSIFNVGTKTVQPLVLAGGLRQMFTERGPVLQPFSPHAQHAIGRDRVYVGDNDTTFLSVYSLDGREHGSIQIADRPVSVTAAHLAKLRERALERIGNDRGRRDRFEHAWDVVPKPSRFPYWGRIVADKVGFLWASSPNVPGAPQVWTIYDPGGRAVEEVQLPDWFRPIEIGRDYMLGVARDEYDVEYVQMYRVTRGGGPE